MAVISCRFQTREAEYAIKGQNTKAFTYIVETDDRMTTDEVYIGALTASPDPLPPLYSFVGSAYVLSVKLSQQTEKTYTRWIATVSCGQFGDGEDPTDGDPGVSGDPLRREIVWWLESVSETEILEKDRNDLAILNTAGQAYDEPPTIERHYPVIVARRNFEDWEDIAAINEKYDNAVNKDSFRGRAVETIKYLGGEAGVQQFENGFRYYSGEFRFQQRPSKWKLEILSKGWRHWTAPVGDPTRKLVDAVDDEGQLVTEPVLLTSGGERLPEGQPGYYLTHYVNPLKNFTPIVDLSLNVSQILTQADL